MRRSAATLIVGWLLGAALGARAQRGPADAGVEQPKHGTRPPRASQRPPADPGGDDPKLTTEPPVPEHKTTRSPDLKGTKDKSPTAGTTPGSASRKGPPKAPTAEDREIIRHLEMLLLLDLFGDYDLFDEQGGDSGTFSDPGGLKEYRP